MIPKNQIEIVVSSGEENKEVKVYSSFGASSGQRMSFTPTTKQRINFEKKVSKGFSNDDCYIWTGCIKSDGYGAFGVGRKSCLAHRFAYLLYCGEIPDNLCVMHKCDVRSCVNPRHLKLGTAADNIHDMENKCRSVHPNGEQVVTSKLKESEVAQIKSLHSSGAASQRSLARKFNVCKTTINRIISGIRWTRIKPK